MIYRRKSIYAFQNVYFTSVFFGRIISAPTATDISKLNSAINGREATTTPFHYYLLPKKLSEKIGELLTIFLL